MFIEDRKVFQKAMIMAHTLHAGQEYGGVAYTRHLAHVVDVLQLNGFKSHVLLSAAWLHDSLEDTIYTRDSITQDFGEEIAGLVWAVTDGQGKNRRERKAESYLKMRANPAAIVIKLADRIANVEAALCGDKPELLGMYQKEHRHFTRELYDASFEVGEYERNLARIMWVYLDELLASPVPA